MRKICKKYAKLDERFDKHKESERRYNLNDEERVEFSKIYHENFRHFEKIQYLVENKYYDNNIIILLDYRRPKPCILSKILIDGQYKTFRYF